MFDLGARTISAVRGAATFLVLGCSSLVLADKNDIAERPVPCLVSSCEPAISARAFAETIGVDVSIEDSAHFDRIVALLKDLRVRHIRVGMYRTESQRRFLQNISLGHIAATLITGDGMSAEDLKDQLLALGTKDGEGFVEAVEGINEPNNPAMPWYASDWPHRTRAQQKMVWNIVKRFSATVSVIGPSVCCNFEDQERLGNLAAFMDFGNMHDYFGTQNPGALYYTGASVIDHSLEMQRAISGDRPVISTETGWGSRVDDKAEGTDVLTQAKYVVRVFFEHRLHGVARTMDFDFLDQPKSNTPFGSYGIVAIAPNGVLRPKSAYYALRHLLDVLSDDPTPFETTGLSFAIVGETEGLHHLLLQKRDGSFYLAVWIETNSWDWRTGLPKIVPTQRVGLRFTTPIARADILRLPTSEVPDPDLPMPVENGSVDFDATDAVQLIHLVPRVEPTTQALSNGNTSSTSLIRSVSSGRCFFVVNASLDGGSRIAQHECKALGNERFVLANGLPRAGTIEDANSRNCLIAGSAAGAQLTTAWGCSPTRASQNFSFKSRGNGEIAIVDSASGLCVTVPGQSKEDGAQLVVAPCDGDRSQAWTLQRAD